MSTESSAVALAIRELVASSGPIQGTDLARRLRQRYPDWTPASAGSRSLKQFIEDSVEQVDAVGRSGLDVVYGLSGSAAPRSAGDRSSPASERAGSDEQTADLWRVWVSPRSPLALAVNGRTGELSAVGRETAAAADDTVVIDPPDQSVHRAIARQFIDDCAGPTKPGLDSIVDSSDEDWWRQWNHTLSAVGLLERWRSYRATAFERRLAGALRSRELSDDLIGVVLASMRQQRSGANARPSHRGSISLGRSSDRSQLERLLIQLLGQMSVNDLRNVSVPIGLVIDALSAE